jgi:hypothetical protein
MFFYFILMVEAALFSLMALKKTLHTHAHGVCSRQREE